jgi:malonate decarboxylase alpha subunit
LAAGSAHSDGKVVGTGDLQGLLHSVIRPGDRVALEGDNQKQTDFLSRTLADCDPSRLHDLRWNIPPLSTGGARCAALASRIASCDGAGHPPTRA